MMEVPNIGSRPSSAQSVTSFVSSTPTPTLESEWKDMTNEQKLKKLRQELAPHQIQEFRTIFNEFDKDSDGRVTLKELHAAYKTLGQDPSEEDLKRMIAGVDEDNSGQVEWLEFLQLMYLNLSGENETDDEIREAFKTFDKDGSGEVSAAEVQAVMSKFGENLTVDQVAEMLQQIAAKSVLTWPDFYHLYATVGRDRTIQATPN
eukprot:NODE_439_length_836_cov_416.892807_g430_i0.p1 GENE.NODE_439_length_836_cov_416.892807_g430_i0~~NODE_439_length_836_cov_416.892807_g430_i0.p1  ORF type:complete len:204 (-),score=45.66 NODE_439_length_836_cov_416.892807_g430_i0:166-777(-)